MIATYTLLKYLHVGCVVLSGAGFALRGAWMLQGSPLLAQRWVRVLPHVVDTVLLASAIALALMLEQYPLVQGWLTAKLIGLVVYIVLGTIALKRGRTRGVRLTAFGAALLVFAYIVAVALTKSVLPYVN
ncbi:MAG: SirB2 family protein [Burkholderiales bacterium]